ncbi:MAG: hypothetical protein A2Y12_08720 [Planctomycetes bacterium GWF2_42_9]|nr:MAG: hypothetical protein A2Y12_08720 [Planctomycetes bacterium GWF2_42_9]HAL45480.1 hypothetical protein [Phycisphaerales bacterium]
MGFEIFLGVLGVLLTVICSLIAWYLHSIIEKLNAISIRQDETDEKVNKLELSFANCKQNCFQTFVEKEDWLREAGNNRVKLDELSATLNRIDGKLLVMDKLPEIAAKIAQNVVKEMKDK